MHGGKGSGPPAGNQNALKHGAYTKKSLKRDKEARELIKRIIDVLDEAQASEARYK